MTTLKESKGSVLGSVLLIAGSTIGAGMLGLPIATAKFGFYPSVAIFFCCWLFMTTTAILFLEVNLWLGEKVHIVTIAEKTLGRIGKWITWVVYIFLFYSLLTAYLDASGKLFSEFFYNQTGLLIPLWSGALVTLIFFGIFIYLGTAPVDFINRLFMFGLIIAYFVVVMIGAKDVHLEILNRMNWKFSFVAVPVVLTSFGFHNMIPSMTHYLRGNSKKMLLTIILGSLIPLLVYLVWEGLILGSTQFQMSGGDPLGLTKGKEFEVITFSSYFLYWVKLFAFFAIVTSFLAQALSLVDFFEDGLHTAKTKITRLLLVLLVLIPPFIFSIANPGAFIIALSYAGGFGAVIIFAILPALMVWVLRYRYKNKSYIIVPGGRILLSFIIFISLCVIILLIFRRVIPN